MPRDGISLLKSPSFVIKCFIILISICFVLEITKTSRARKIFSNFIRTPSLRAIGYRLPSLFPDLLPKIENNTNKPPKPMKVSTTTNHPNTSSMVGVCEFADKDSPLLARRFPHIIIIGFGKAGTRATYQMIRMHPNIVGPPHEIRFFSNSVNYKRGLNFYISQLPTTNPSQRTIVKSPDYIIKQEAAIRLQKALLRCQRNKDIKFIVILRDPFDRTVSEYLHWQLYVLNTMKKRLPSLKKQCVKQSGEINSLNKQVNASIYSYHLENWLKYYGMKNICFVDGDKLLKNPYSEMKNLEKCLDLRSFLQPRHFYFNKVRGLFCPVDPGGHPACLGKSKGRLHPKINEDVEHKLRHFFQPYNKRLYNITGVNYGW